MSGSALANGSEHIWQPVWTNDESFARRLKVTGPFIAGYRKASVTTFCGVAADVDSTKGKSVEEYFIKKTSIDHTDAPPLPYCLPEIGKFTVDGDTYCVYVKYPYNLSALFYPDYGPDKKLNNWWGKLNYDSKEKTAASVFLRMMFTIRSLYLRERFIFDIKIFNAVCNLIDNADPAMQLDTRMIDLETMHSGVPTSSEFAPSNPVAYSLGWQSPAVFAMEISPGEEESQHFMRFSDLYSMGLLLYWLYSEGDTVWPAGANWLDNDFVEKYRSNYYKLYYSSDSEVEVSGLLKVIDGSNFAFAADSGKVAALIKKMLSLPQKGITNIQLCEKFITEYCGILAENDRLPDMEIPGRFIPSSRGISTGGALDIMLEMHVEQNRGTEGTHSWSEKRVLRLPDREVRNIPLNFHRSVWKASSPYRVNFDNILFLTVVEKKLYYRVLNDPDKLLVIRLNGNDAPCFGEFSKDDNLSFSLNEEGKETHCIAVSPRIREVTS